VCGSLPRTPLPVVIDTDPALMVRAGLDIDDDLALLCALGSPELDIRGITVTYGNTSVGRAYDDARRLLEMAGRTDIPIYKGAGWLGRDVNRTTEASRFLVESFLGPQQGLEIVTLGPLTNFAAALRAAPEIAGRIQRHVALGGRTTSGRREFNFSAHPEATNRVLAARLPRVIVPIEVCSSVVFTRRELDAIEARPMTVVFALRRHIRRFMRRKELSRPLLSRIKRSGCAPEGFHPWDVVAIVYLLRPELFTQIQSLEVWMQGTRVMNRPAGLGSRPGCGALVPFRVDAAAVLDVMMERLGRVRWVRDGDR